MLRIVKKFNSLKQTLSNTGTENKTGKNMISIAGINVTSIEPVGIYASES